MTILLLSVGFAALILGGNFLVHGAASLAHRLRIPPMAIALTLVAFGTSAPEWVVSISAAVAGRTDMIFGNVIGSNVINVALVLGLAAVVRTLPARPWTVRIEVPLAVFAAAVIWLQASDRSYGLTDGLVLLSLFVAFVAYVAVMMRRPDVPFHAEDSEHLKAPLVSSILRTVVGIPMLIVGGNVVVESAGEIARLIGISERVIGASVVAIGTSLPELVTSVVAVARRQTDIAVGNIVGSNIFNTFLILGSAAAIRPIAVPFGGGFDLAVNAGIVVVLLLFLFTGRGRAIERWEGALLLLAFVGYESALLLG